MLLVQKIVQISCVDQLQGNGMLKLILPELHWFVCFRCQILRHLHYLFGIPQCELGYHQLALRQRLGFLSIFIWCMNFQHHNPSKECVKFTTVELVSYYCCYSPSLITCFLLFHLLLTKVQNAGYAIISFHLRCCPIIGSSGLSQCMQSADKTAVEGINTCMGPVKM